MSLCILRPTSTLEQVARITIEYSSTSFDARYFCSWLF